MRRAVQHHIDGVLLLRRRLRRHHGLHVVPARGIRVADSGRRIHRLLALHQPDPISQVVPAAPLLVRLRPGRGERSQQRSAAPKRTLQRGTRPIL